MVNSLGLQYCICITGFSGSLCQYSVNCSGSPCNNGGICTNNAGGGYTCNCSANYYGSNCNYNLSGQQCSLLGDTNRTACISFKSNGYCNFNYFYNAIPVPLYCASTCNLCQQSNSTCQGNKFLKNEFQLKI